MKGFGTSISYISNYSSYSFSNDKEKVHSLQFNALKASLEHHTQKMYEYAQKIQQLEKELEK